MESFVALGATWQQRGFVVVSVRLRRACEADDLPACISGLCGVHAVRFNLFESFRRGSHG